MLPVDFQFSVYRITLEFTQTCRLPPFKGATLRGGFGITFKKLICIQWHDDCADCPLKYQCVYARLFESFNPPDAEVLKAEKDLPRPFVVTPLDHQTELFRPQDTLDFELVLIGSANAYLAYFIYTFTELGKHGLGRDRGRFRVKTVRAEQSLSGETELLYEADQGSEMRPNRLIISGDLFNGDPDPADHPATIRLTFETPTTIKQNGKIQSQPDFAAVFGAALRRLSTLSHIYCNAPLDLDFRGLMDTAATVRTIRSGVHWSSFERTSQKRKEKMTMGGVLGEMDYEGDIVPFLPVLRVGRFVHVGKLATFGFGKYRPELLLKKTI